MPRWLKWLLSALLAAVLGFVWWATAVLHRSNMTWSDASRVVHQTGGVRLLRYYLVSVGTPEAELRTRFGPPDLEARARDTHWQRYNDGRHRAGWSVPTRCPTSKVIVYEAATDHWLVVAYYYIDPSGKVEYVFVGET